MRNLFQRAACHQPLTPGERALLRLIEGLICAALVAALPILADALGSASVNWADVARAALAAAAVAVLLALAKYARAHGDPELGDALGELGTQLGAVVSHDDGHESGHDTGARPAGEAQAVAVVNGGAASN